MKKGYIAYIALIIIALMVPFVGMSFWMTTETTENKEMSRWPQLIEDGNYNTDYLEEAGTYFEEHMAFRLQMLTANSAIWGKIFHTSTTDQVIVGEDDWLYYGGTANDYTGRDLLSDRELYNIVYNLSLVQEFMEKNGSQFLLAVVPNKNTLYGDHMPYYYQPGTDSNLDRLNKLLEQNNIHFIDLKEAFQNEEEVLYFKRDSHWNNKGAVLAYNEILDYLGKDHETYLNVPYEVRTDHVGDIDEILYPLAAEKEEDFYYEKDWEYQYVNDVTDNMDAWIETVNAQKEGSLLMYRDSFGESILPFLAEEYGNSYFSRLVPYNFGNIIQYHPDVVIIERVERNISALATEIPIMEAPETDNVAAAERQTNSTIECRKSGGYLEINGSIEQELVEDDTEIVVCVSDADRTNMKTYKPFYTLTEDGNGNGYSMYLNYAELPSDFLHINVICKNGENAAIVASEDISLEE